MKSMPNQKNFERLSDCFDKNNTEKMKNDDSRIFEYFKVSSIESYLTYKLSFSNNLKADLRIMSIY